MMAVQKIGIPNQSGLIERARLQQTLSNALQYRVTLLRAPAGCGKTMLAAQTAQAVQAPVIWQTITPYMQDARIFYRRLLDLLVQVAPEMQTLYGSLHQPDEIIAHDMALLLRTALSGHLLLVLDDWHIFGIQRNTLRWLNTFIAAMPENCHILLTSRTLPALNTVQLVARREILTIPQEELFFNEAEVYLLAARLRPGKPADPQAIQTIWESMRGWPAGTVLALQPASSRVVRELNQDLPPSELLFQEIARDILQHQPPDTLRFLKWSSILDSFTPDILEDIFGIGDWAQSLADIQQQNLFLLQDGSGFRYHHLFRSFLQNHFRLNQPDEFAAAHRRAAAWYQAHGASDHAIDHYLQADAPDRAVELIESLVYTYFMQGRVETLRQFRTLLSGIAVSAPHLDHVNAKISLDFDYDPEQAIHYADLALAQFRAAGEHSWALEATIQHGEALLRLARYQEALTIFSSVYADPEARPIQRGNSRMRMGTCALLTADYAQAVLYLEESLPLLEEHAGAYDRSLALQSLEMAYRAAGRIADANTCLHRLVDLRRQLDNPEALASALNNLGYRYYEQGQMQSAREAYQQGLEAVRYLQSSSSRYHLYSSFADLERDLGFYEQARDYYQKALALVADREPAARCEMLLHLAALYRWQSRYEAALTCTEEALELARQHKIETMLAQTRITALQIQLQTHTARNISGELRSLTDGGAPVDLMVLRLRVAYMQQQETVYHSILTELQERYCGGESVQPFFAECLNNLALAELLRRYSSRYAQLIAALDLLRTMAASSADRVIIPMEAPVYHLQCYTFKSASVRRDGRYIPASDWNSTLSRELFFYLIFHKQVTRDQITLMFWPDRSLDSVRDSFAQIMTRMRHVIGTHSVLYDEQAGIYHFNPQIRLWCDALQLERLVEEASKLSPDSPRAYDAWYQAAQLPAGDFLPEFERDWIYIRRLQYHKLALTAWNGLAQFYSAQRDYHNALRAYESAAEIDPFYEQICRGQMSCWARLGERARVIDVYRSLEARLRQEYQTTPSDDTRSLFLRLVQ